MKLELKKLQTTDGSHEVGCHLICDGESYGYINSDNPGYILNYLRHHKRIAVNEYRDYIHWEPYRRYWYKCAVVYHLFLKGIEACEILLTREELPCGPIW